MRTARQLNCALCHRLVQICNRCDHGNVYCSKECALVARKNYVRQANKRYQNTYRAKVMHAKRQHKYRQRKRVLLHSGVPPENKVTDHSSEALPNSVSLPIVPTTPEAPKTMGHSTDIYCCVCGSLCSNLLRRDFLQTGVIKKVVKTADGARGP